MTGLTNFSIERLTSPSSTISQRTNNEAYLEPHDGASFKNLDCSTQLRDLDTQLGDPCHRLSNHVHANKGWTSELYSETKHVGGKMTMTQGAQETFRKQDVATFATHASMTEEPRESTPSSPKRKV